MEYILFAHQPYGFPFRARFIRKDLMTVEMIEEFYALKNNINYDHQILMKWLNSIVDNDSSNYFDMDGNELEIPEWLKTSFYYYGKYQFYALKNKIIEEKNIIVNDYIFYDQK